MNSCLISFLSKYDTFNDEERRIIETNSLIKEYAKGEFLVRSGQIATHTYLVLQGCVRSYYLNDGNEQNTAFFTEHDIITPVSYSKNLASNYFIECLEPCIISHGSKEKTEDFLSKHPRFSLLCHKINDAILAQRQTSWDHFRNLSPEEHYLELTKSNPDLLKRIPQYHLASYLGIKPQSLSRIKKRLSKQNH
ncbi:Crp/Fnr family transcriptional regulator [Agaribacterium sp. ZY112]|uniref:Crp/Fnr family transcriptional regulator n=1 Tax=Agaribacterium sp. ZY112 TaxID=3233574 RepID=UPI0035248264